MSEWFRRLAEVPDAEYAGSAGVDRSRLRWARMTPKRQPPVSIPGLPEYEDDEERYHWEYPDETFASQSPASRYWDQGAGLGEEPDEAVSQRLGEALELPGTLKDYHFILLSAAEELRHRARATPELLSTVEQMCQLDVRITASQPDLFSYIDGDGERQQYRVPALDILARLYRSEGAVHEWLAVEEQAAKLSQGDPDAVRELIAQLEAGLG